MAALGAVAALATRAPGLDRPRILVFDELYYALQAREIAAYGVERGHTVHPPLGKWLLAAGVRVLGFDPVGWRIVPLLAGALVVAVTMLAVWHATRSRSLSALGGFLVLTDGIAFTTGRLALLDGLLALFTTVALAAMLQAGSRPLDAPLQRRAALVTAVALGAGISTKWSAAPLVLVALCLFCALTTGIWGPGPRRRRELRRTIGVVLGIPIAMYALSYVPILVNFGPSGVRREVCSGAEQCDDSLVGRLGAIVDDQLSLVRFHRTLVPKNRFAASALTWVVQAHPAGLLLSECDGGGDPVCPADERGTERRMIAVGNPLVWLAGTGALLACAWSAVRRRELLDAVVASCAGVLWLPWILGGRPGYSFYAIVVLPMLVVAMARALARTRRSWRRFAMGALVVAGLTGAVVLWPVWTAHPTAPGYPFGWFDGI